MKIRNVLLTRLWLSTLHIFPNRIELYSKTNTVASVIRFAGNTNNVISVALADQAT